MQYSTSKCRVQIFKGTEEPSSYEDTFKWKKDLIVHQIQLGLFSNDFLQKNNNKNICFLAALSRSRSDDVTQSVHLFFCPFIRLLFSLVSLKYLRLFKDV